MLKVRETTPHVKLFIVQLHVQRTKGTVRESLLVPLTIPGTKFNVRLHMQCVVNSLHNCTCKFSPVWYPCQKGVG